MDDVCLYKMSASWSGLVQLGLGLGHTRSR